jgi:tetratricopeptide (TPR) repeat protein
LPEAPRAPRKLEDPPPADAGVDAPVSAELSALLAELARIPEVELDVDASWAPDPKAGDVVGRFVLQRELGRGGFGVVYEALDRELGRTVAFKSIRPGRRHQGRSEAWLRSEAEAVARLNHPNIVTLHDFGRGPNGPYLIFELLRGTTLAERLQAGALPLRDAVDVAVDVARVLAHAHAAEVVHRDLKPANVFLSHDGTVKVLDFGLAHLFGRAGPNGGTPSYMAPEQWRNEPDDARTDLFALGVLLHHMLSGAVPYRVTRERSEALDPGPPPALPREVAPAALRRLVSHLLEKDPGARPRSAQDVLDVLLPLQQRLRRPAWSRRSRGLAVLVAGLAVAALGAAVALRGAPAAGAPLVVAVADFENGTGEGDLDGLSGLLITSLEQSRRLQVVTRSRLVGLLGRIGKPEARRLDEPVARELARAAGAGVLLVASVRRADDTYALELSGVDPHDGKLFSVEERAPAKADVLGAVDRLSDAVRRALRERNEQLRAARIEVAQAVTPSVEAYQAYFEGLDCWDRPSRRSWAESGACAARFREALARDPGFALAHYQLAFILQTEGRPAADVQTHLQAALRAIDRAPPKEAALVRAWEAHVSGRDEEALRAYGRILEEYPDDKHALYVAAYILSQRKQWAEAVPYLERLLSVDPSAEWALDDLVTALAMLRRWDALRDLVERTGDDPATPAQGHARVRGLVWLGAAGEALEAARRAVERGGGGPAELDLASVLTARGDVEEAEALLERLRAAQPSDLQTAWALARTIAMQGRRREALALVDGLASGAETQDVGINQ